MESSAPGRGWRRTLKLTQGWVLFLNKGRETRAEDASLRKGAVKKEKLSQTGECLPEGIESCSAHRNEVLAHLDPRCLAKRPVGPFRANVLGTIYGEIPVRLGFLDACQQSAIWPRCDGC